MRHTADAQPWSSRIPASLIDHVAADSESGNINSIVKLLALNTPAEIPELKNGKGELAVEVLQAEIREIRSVMEAGFAERGRAPRHGSIAAIEFERISNTLEKLKSSDRIVPNERTVQLHMLLREAEQLMMSCESAKEHDYFRSLMARIHRAIQSIG